MKIVYYTLAWAISSFLKNFIIDNFLVQNLQRTETPWNIGYFSKIVEFLSTSPVVKSVPKQQQKCKIYLSFHSTWDL